MFTKVFEDGNDSAEAYAGAAGAYRRYWTWNGPPGTAPGGSPAPDHDGRCLALARILETVRKPDYLTTELAITQARWAVARTTAAKLSAELTASLSAARQAFTRIEGPTREHRALMSKLDRIEENLRGQDQPSE